MMNKRKYNKPIAIAIAYTAMIFPYGLRYGVCVRVYRLKTA